MLRVDFVYIIGSMNFLTLLVDSIVGFVRRNPIFCLVVLMLALLAPSLLKGIAAFVLYFILAIVLFGVVILALLRWKLYRMQREMQGQFSQQQRAAGGAYRSHGFGGTAQPNQKREGEVKIYVTSDKPEKRISDDVGDYVEFEETKNQK